MTAADDRAEQIRARISLPRQANNATAEWAKDREDLLWLWEEFLDLRERVASESQRADEASERADETWDECQHWKAERTELLRRVEQAERAGAVKALAAVRDAVDILDDAL